MKRVLRSEQFRYTADKGKPLPREERRRAILSIKPLQFWLVFKQLQLAGRPRHVKINHTTYFRWKLRRKWRKRGSGIPAEVKRGSLCSRCFHGRHKLRGQRSEKESPQTSPQAPKEVAAR